SARAYVGRRRHAWASGSGGQRDGLCAQGLAMGSAEAFDVVAGLSERDAHIRVVDGRTEHLVGNALGSKRKPHPCAGFVTGDEQGARRTAGALSEHAGGLLEYE